MRIYVQSDSLRTDFHIININGNLDIVLFAAAAAVQNNINFGCIDAFFSIVRDFYVKIGNNDLIFCCVYFIQTLQIIRKRFHTVTCFRVHQSLSVAKCLNLLTHFGCEIMHDHTVTRCGRNIIRTQIIEIRTSVGIIPDSGLYTGNHICSCQVLCPREPFFFKFRLHMFHRNIWVGIGNDSADVCCLFRRIVVTVFKVQTLVINAVLITCNSIAAVQNFIVACAQCIHPGRSPGVVGTCIHKH